MIELPKYPKNVFLFIILQYCKAQENLLLTLKQESQKWVIRSETQCPQEFNKGGWHGRGLLLNVNVKMIRM